METVRVRTTFLNIQTAKILIFQTTLLFPTDKQHNVRQQENNQECNTTVSCIFANDLADSA